MGLFSGIKKAVANLSEEAAKARAEVSTGASWEAQITPINTRIKTAIKSTQELYPHEVLMLHNANGRYFTDGNEFPRYWWYDYGVKDPQVIIDTLLQRGFLETGTIRVTIEKQLVPQLKELLNQYGLKTTGKKADLVQRIVDGIPSIELDELFPRRVLAATKSGEQALKEGAYVIYINTHRNMDDLDIWTLNKLVYSPPRLPFRDKIWGYLNNKGMEHAARGDFGLYRNTRSNMAEFLLEESRYKEAIGMLAEVVFWDLAITENNFNPEYLEIYAQHVFYYQKQINTDGETRTVTSLATTAPGTVQRIFDCQKELGLSDKELRAIIADRMNRISVPIQIFTVQECIDVIFLERDKNVEELEKLYKKAKKNFQQKYPNIKL